MTLGADSSPETGDWATQYLGLELAPASNADMAGFGKAVGMAAMGLALRPVGVSVAGARFAAGLARLPASTAARWLGQKGEPVFQIDARDRRFADPAWTDNPAFYALRQYFAALSQLTEELVSDAGLSTITERKARLAAELVLDMLAPTNFLPTNPAALPRAFETGGASVLKGARNFVDDVLHNDGRPRQVDASAFTVGENLAATPCKVVYRNELMELLQYEPQTDQVHATPLLCSPPWINKYYIMDLAPGRSFIEWAVKHGPHGLRDQLPEPGAEMAHVTMDDYLIQGPQTALDVIADITGADTIDIVGLCLGGALTAITDAYLTQSGDAADRQPDAAEHHARLHRPRRARRVHRGRTRSTGSRRRWPRRATSTGPPWPGRSTSCAPTT